MDDAVGSDHFGVVDYAALDLEHDVCGERLAEVALTCNDCLNCGLETRQVSGAG
jgi:hypothetical protein